MFKALASYLRSQVWPRRREIRAEPELYLAISVGIAMAVWGSRLPVAESDVGDVTTVALAYAALAFGFCIAGLTMAMTPPDAGFTKMLVNFRPRTPEERGQRTRPPFQENAYSKLLFVYSWTALMHWLTIATSLVTVVARGSDDDFFPDSACLGTRVLAGVLTCFLLYAAMQFLVTVITLSQFGNAYADHMRDDPAGAAPRDDDQTPPGEHPDRQDRSSPDRG